MKNISSTLEIHQEPWQESPCSTCSIKPCCRHLPLDNFYLNSISDYIDLLILSCYMDIHLLLKESGEWTVYLKRSCQFFQDKCSIHGMSCQSLICKGYDAWKCWYAPAFAGTENDKVIHFNLQRLLCLDDLWGITSRQKSELSWKELKEKLKGIPCSESKIYLAGENWTSHRPSTTAKEALRTTWLFFPPYSAPDRKLHFELVKFRLGFPGIALSRWKNRWFYSVKAKMNYSKFNIVLKKMFPALKPYQCRYSMLQLNKKMSFTMGEKDRLINLLWQHIERLQSLCEFDSNGNITAWPSDSLIENVASSGDSHDPGRPDSPLKSTSA